MLLQRYALRRKDIGRTTFGQCLRSCFAEYLQQNLTYLLRISEESAIERALLVNYPPLNTLSGCLKWGLLDLSLLLAANENGPS